MTKTIDEIRSLPYVQSANEWRDRIYINLVGNGGNYAGERNTKIYVKAGCLIVEMGKGAYTTEWSNNLKALKSVMA